MAVDKDLEAFVDFLEERGVPVLQSLGNVDLDRFDVAADGGGIATTPTTTTGDLDNAKLDTPQPLQPPITKEAIVLSLIHI